MLKHPKVNLLDALDLSESEIDALFDALDSAIEDNKNDSKELDHE